MNDEYYMMLAIKEAQKAEEMDEVPVGAVIVDENQRIIGRGFNRPISTHDPTSHAEINAIRAACNRLNNYRLPKTSLYVTIEPCIMCMGAIIHTRIDRVVYGAPDPKWGAAASLYKMAEDHRLNHSPEIVPGICEEEAKAIIKGFFRKKRRNRDKHSCCGNPVGG
ncbi:MAG: tRNA adenosine(34) deaminase TadA [Desulfobacter sp.]|nr:MAG: tRNA adenosine(34) deaminase TadA [Desulfobacter sp.]